MPPAELTIQTDTYHHTAGVLLQGSLREPAEAQQLQQALEPLIRNPELRHIWLDCQHLHHLSRQGQRALLIIDQQARQAGTSLHWCGLSEDIMQQLVESGLYLLLHLLPASSYHSPGSAAPDLPYQKR